MLRQEVSVAAVDFSGGSGRGYLFPRSAGRPGVSGLMMSSQEMNHIELSCVSFEHEGSRNLKKQSVLLTPRAQSNRTVLVNSIGHPRVSFDVSFIVFSRQLGPRAWAFEQRTCGHELDFM